ncbi:MAG: CARDB domain-containing protein [Candidatus Thermoplasmatota archaeon]
MIYNATLDLIVNNANSPYIIDTFPRKTGFVLVEESGNLTILNGGGLTIAQASTSQHTFVVRENGVVNLDGAEISTNNYAMWMYLRDNAVLRANSTALPSTLNIMASDNARIYLEDCSVGGNLDTQAGASVLMQAGNTTFARQLDDVQGSSTFTMVACSVPLIRTYDSASVTIYRWLTLDVRDGVDPGYPIEGATVSLRYALKDPALAALLKKDGSTDTAGRVEFMAMSDIITPDVYPSSHFVGNYKIWVNYTYGSWTSAGAVVGLTLAQYPAMTDSDNYPLVSVRLLDVLPDLDPPLWASNNNPGRGQPITFTTNITNTGVADAYNVLVQIRDNTTGEIIDNRWISEIKKDGYCNFTTDPWAFDVLGDHNITITVDPYDEIPELDDNEVNFNWTIVRVRGLADMAFLYTTDISIAPVVAVVNHTISITATVRNLGDIPTGTFELSFYVFNGTMVIVAEDAVDVTSIPAGASMPVTTSSWTPTIPGTYTISVVADEDKAVEEFSDENNWINTTKRIYDYADLFISDLTFSPISPMENNTAVTVTAIVHNLGETSVSNVLVRFYEDSMTRLIGTYTISYLPGSGGTGPTYAYAYIPWTATCTGRSQTHTIIVEAVRDPNEPEGGGQSNIYEEEVLVLDRRADLEVYADGIVPVGAGYAALDNVTENSAFKLNVTVYNTGNLSVQNVTADVFDGTVIIEALDSYLGEAGNASLYSSLMDAINTSWLGNITVQELQGFANTTVTISCKGLSGVGPHRIAVVLDLERNGTDALIGSVDEFSEWNNQANITLDVVMPTLYVVISGPEQGFQYKLWSADNLNVVGVVRDRETDQGVSGVNVTVELRHNGEVVSATNVTTGGNGGFNTLDHLTAPNEVGTWEIWIYGEDVPYTTREFIVYVPAAPIPWWLYLLVVIIIVVAVVVAITLYYYFVGMGKLVECGECGAFIPEGSVKCPKCGVEFEVETAKCSVCGAWVPADAKICPECGSEFTTGEEIVEDYEVTMRRQYEEFVAKMRENARAQGVPDHEFEGWWAMQPSYITFDQWLRDEEEMRRMGAAPCPACGTPNSVAATVCHRCGTVIGAKPKGKMPTEPVVPPAAVVPPTPAAPGETRKCPECGMDIDVKERVCPVCGHEFEPPAKEEEAPPEPKPVEPKRVVKKVIRKPISVPREEPKPPETTAEGEEKKEG